MEDKVKSDEESPKEIKTGSGAVLASARKQQNRTVEEIAAELNLSVTQIKTIELDQSEGLPEPTYVRGYIRSYAKLLGLDPEQVLESYLNPNWQKTSSLEDLPRGLSGAESANTDSGIALGKPLALILIAALAAYLWFSGSLDNLLGSTQSESTTSTIITDTEDSVGQPAVPLASDQATQEALDSAQRTEGDSVDENRLVLTFAETSWVDIRDGDDNRLAYKSYAQGEELSVSSANSMSVFIGNAEGVTANYNGTPFDISPYREGVYAKFNLGED